MNMSQEEIGNELERMDAKENKFHCVCVSIYALLKTDLSVLMLFLSS